MEPFDFSKEYGLVLEGGGAKGAYQIGVWKALKEYGVKIKGVSGVSVGALNGALICMDDIKKAQEVWENISYSKVMSVNHQQMEKLMEGKFHEINLAQLTKESAEVLAERGLDIEPLKNWIEELVDEEKIKNSPYEFILGTFSLTRFKELEIDAKSVEPGLLKDFLLASSYFPAFKNEKLHGEKFVDGGIFNNVPVDMLIKRGYEHIIVVRIYGVGLEKKIHIPENVHIVEIAPKVSLGSMMEFEAKKSRRNLKIGYYDGLRCLKNLSGHIYYIDSIWKEEMYLKRLLSIPEDVVKEWILYYKLDRESVAPDLRLLLEKVYPAVAKELKLLKDWNYKDLYLALLELSAKTLRIAKYQVYQEATLLEKVRQAYASRDLEGKISKFVEIILKVIITP